MRTLVAIAVFAFAAAAAAGDVAPGNWEFTINTTTEGLGALAPKPGPIVRQRCISEEEAKNPGQILGDAGTRGDCQFSNQRDTGSAYSFDVRCTAPVPVTGSGQMRYSRDTLDGTLDLASDVQGMKFTTKSQISARRLGACSS